MSFIHVLILTILPVLELRGGIPIAIVSGINPLLAFIFCTSVNILIIFPIFFFLDKIHGQFTKARVYRVLFNKYIGKVRRKLEKHTKSRWVFVFLFLVVLVPAPGTGAYTGSLLAWFFNLERKKSYLAIALGVLVAGIIITLVSIGLFNFFSSIFS